MSTLIRYSSGQEDRYAYDRYACSQAKGWAQVDTWQDASYFGVWTNPEQRTIVTYCEGDLSFERCADDHDYRRSLVTMLGYYDTPEKPARIDVKTLHPSHPMRDTLVRLGLAGRLH